MRISWEKVEEDTTISEYFVERLVTYLIHKYPGKFKKALGKNYVIDTVYINDAFDDDITFHVDDKEDLRFVIHIPNVDKFLVEVCMFLEKGNEDDYDDYEEEDFLDYKSIRWGLIEKKYNEVNGIVSEGENK